VNHFFKQIRRSALTPAWVLIFLIAMAVLGDFIAAEKSKSFIPPLIPYAFYEQDAQNTDFVSPFSSQNVSSIYYRHWLGTDKLGRDVLAGLISGTRIALLIGLGGMTIALFFGLFMGMTAGYFGNDRFRLTKMGLVLRGVLFPILLFYFSVFFQQNLPFYVYLLLILAVFTLMKLGDFIFSKIPFLNKPIVFLLDTVIMRIVEILQAIPTILWLLGLIATTGQMSILGLTLFIGLISWTTTARLVRGEIMRIRQLEYMETAQVLGFSHARILLRHALPNVLTPVLIALAFGIAHCILLEATLTFIGLGLPIELVTWGSMLAEARNNPAAWWLVVCPGFMIFITVYSLNRLGEALNEK
jgi:peptide/nickel transport system permease protein